MEAMQDLEQHRVALTGHCYRMLGSVMDADDAVQETMIRAWKARERFDGRSSLRTWLYRIATNVCLDEIEGRGRRARPMEEGAAGTTTSPLEKKPRTHWLEPVPDKAAIPAEEDPARQLVMKESVRLAFVSALQQLPGRQRAALLLADVLDWSAAEVAESLGMTVAAVNSALQRARSTVAEKRGVNGPGPLTTAQAELLERYVAAFESYDVEGLVSLLRSDSAFSMPPYDLWLQGPAPVREWLLGKGAGCRGSKLVASAANGSPAFGQYRVDAEGGYKAWALVVLELEGEAIVGWNSFLDVEMLFPRFGLALRLA